MKLPEFTRESLREQVRGLTDERRLNTDDAEAAARMGLAAGMSAARALFRASTLELERKPFLLGIRDRLMQDNGLKQTPADDEARRSPEYVAYGTRAADYQALGNELQHLSAYYEQRARLLASERLVAGV